MEDLLWSYVLKKSTGGENDPIDGILCSPFPRVDDHIQSVEITVVIIISELGRPGYVVLNVFRRTSVHKCQLLFVSLYLCRVLHVLIELCVTVMTLINTSSFTKRPWLLSPFTIGRWSFSLNLSHQRTVTYDHSTLTKGQFGLFKVPLTHPKSLSLLHFSSFVPVRLPTTALLRVTWGQS